MDEVWRPVVGFEGRYSVSDLGRVRSEARTCKGARGSVQTLKEMILKPSTRGRYPDVCLYLEGKRKTLRLASLVLRAFVGPRPDGLVICHNDGNEGNSRRLNLRYDTPKANSEDQRIHGTKAFGERAGGAKLTEQQVLAICSDRRSVMRICNDFPVGRQQVRNIKNRAAWRHILEKR